MVQTIQIIHNLVDAQSSDTCGVSCSHTTYDLVKSTRYLLSEQSSGEGVSQRTSFLKACGFSSDGNIHLFYPTSNSFVFTSIKKMLLTSEHKHLNSERVYI